MIRTIIVCEGEYDCHRDFSTEVELENFRNGLEYGASKYGAGGCLLLRAEDYKSLATSPNKTDQELAKLVKTHLLGDQQ